MAEGMFAQALFGRVADPGRLRRLWDGWHEGLAAGAEGWRSSTAGITPGGELAAVVRFASAEAARANADRPEQDQWWQELQGCIEGPVEVLDTADITVHDECGDEAGFVQLMRARCKDRAAFQAVEDEIGEPFRAARPDVLGAIRLWQPDDRLVAVDWFSSEEEARAGESVAMPDEVQEGFGRWMGLLEDLRWYDLPDPWLASP